MPTDRPTALEILLARLASGRNAPLPEPAPPMSLGPLSTDTALAYAAQNPEPVRPRFIQPTLPDASLINQEVGAAPAPPAPRSRAERIFNAIAGFGAGVQGQGPQFLAQLQEPQRRYEAQLERYQGRRTEALERAERRAEREAAQANRANELAYERDFKVWLSKNNDRSDEAKQRMAQMFTLQRDATRARLEEERAQRQERRQMEMDARHISDQFFGITRNKTLSDEIGKYRAGLIKSLSPAAAALERRVTQLGDVRMNKAARIGGGAATSKDAKLVEQFEALKRQLYPARRRGDTTQEDNILRRIEAVGAKLQAKGYEVGYGKDPYVLPPRGAMGQPQAAAPAQDGDVLGVGLK